jgi:SNF2 family DNA or RNA helicase
MKHYNPYVYQRKGTDFLIETPRAALFAGMGLGKTSMTMAALDLLAMAGSNYFPALVIAPKRVAQVVWSEEAAKWDAFQGLNVCRLIGTETERLAALKGPKADIYTINYENIEWLCTQFTPERWPFRIVIADESTRLKGFRLQGGGSRTRALSFIARHTGRWINLTGTPITNGMIDMWGQYWFLDFGQRLRRTYTQFESEWFEVNQYSRERKLRPGAADELMALTKDITLSLKTEDCLPVLKTQYIQIECELPKKARRQYDEMEAKFFLEDFGEFGIEAPSAAAKSAKLMQMASGFIYDENHEIHDIHDAKIEALRELKRDIDEPLLVAYYWNPADIHKLKKAFPDARLYNSDQDRLDWNAGKVDMFLLHPASGGHGLDFADGGRNIVFFSQTWNLEYRQQIIERLGAARQFQAGHHRVCRVFDLLALDTVDYACMKRNEGKLSIQEALMDYQRR